MKRYIYKYTSPSGKSYIGQTKDIYFRKLGHKSNSNNPQSNCYNSVFYTAIRKYGLDNFSFDIIEETDIENVDNREKYWIEYYDTYNNGYNSTIGGQHKKYSSRETHKTHKVFLEDGSEFLIENLAKFCRDNNYEYKDMKHLLDPRQNFYIERYGFNNGKVRYKDTLNSNVFFDPHGNKIETNNLKQWCKDNNFEYPLFHMINLKNNRSRINKFGYMSCNYDNLNILKLTDTISKNYVLSFDHRKGKSYLRKLTNLDIKDFNMLLNTGELGNFKIDTVYNCKTNEGNNLI